MGKWNLFRGGASSPAAIMGVGLLMAGVLVYAVSSREAAVAVTGKACLGKNNDSLVESMQDLCKKGDTVATKHPAYFCDFHYAVTYNNYNSAICIYAGRQKPERAG